MAERECLRASHDGANCEGEVSGRQATTTIIYECEHHMAESEARNHRISRDYGLDSDVPPAWFDPAYAGERWDEEY